MSEEKPEHSPAIKMCRVTLAKISRRNQFYMTVGNTMGTVNTVDINKRSNRLVDALFS